jgi:membrane peptidoglycan carboxypeptidase
MSAKKYTKYPCVRIDFHDNDGNLKTYHQYIDGEEKSIHPDSIPGSIYIPSQILNGYENCIKVSKSTRGDIIDTFAEIIFGKWITTKILSPLLSFTLRHTGYRVSSQVSDRELSVKYSFGYHNYFPGFFKGAIDALFHQKINLASIATFRTHTGSLIGIFSILSWLKSNIFRENSIKRQEIYHGDTFVIKRVGFNDEVRLTFYDRDKRIAFIPKAFWSFFLKLILLVIGILLSIICYGAFGIDTSGFPNVPDTRKPMEIHYAKNPNSNEAGILYGRSPDKNTLKEFSPHLIDALISKEDSRFYLSPGVDLYSPLAMLRGRGGSGLTPQVARKLYARELGFNREQDVKNSPNANILKLDFNILSLTRKFAEMGLALKLDWLHSKDTILRTYLNRVSSSWEADDDNNSVNFEDRGNKYFGKPVSELNISESAMLVGLLTNPTVQDPCNQRSAKIFIKNKIIKLEEKINKHKTDLVGRTDEDRTELNKLKGNRFYHELNLERLYDLEKAGKLIPEDKKELNDYKRDPKLYALMARILKDKEKAAVFNKAKQAYNENWVTTLKRDNPDIGKKSISILEDKNHQLKLKIKELANEITGIHSSIRTTKQKIYKSKAAIDNLQRYLDEEYHRIDPSISELAEDTQKIVLNTMRNANKINDTEYERFKRIKLKDFDSVCNAKSRLNEMQLVFFNEEVDKELKEIGKTDTKIKSFAENKNYIIETSVDRDLQEKAQQAFESYLTKEGEEYNFDQGAIVTLDTRTGLVKAMVGGYTDPHYQDIDPEDKSISTIYPGHGINHVTANNRQPGSIFKLFSYGAAMMQNRYASNPDRFLAKTYPCYSLKTGSNQCEHAAGKQMNVFSAITHSENSVAITVAKEVGVNEVKNFAKQLGVGLTKPLNSEDVRGFVLGGGGNEVSLLEMTGAYAAVANGGTWNRPQIIKSIGSLCKPNDQDCQKMEAFYDFSKDDPSRTRQNVMSPEVAQTLTKAFKNVVKEGTGKNAQIALEVAGKTGTTDENRNVWFIGFIPEQHVVTGVWLGNENQEPLKDSSKLAAKLWGNYMGSVYGKVPPKARAVQR